MGRRCCDERPSDPAVCALARLRECSRGRGGAVHGRHVQPGRLTARVSRTATLLPDGRVLVIGGTSINASAFWRRSGTRRWTRSVLAGSLAEARDYHTVTLLPDGRVLVIGGAGIAGSYLASAELWDPTTASFGPAGVLAEGRGGHTSTLLPDGRVLIVGGEDNEGNVSTSAEVWDP